MGEDRKPDVEAIPEVDRAFLMHLRAARVANIDPAVALEGFEVKAPKVSKLVGARCACGKPISDNKRSCLKCAKYGS